MTGFLAKMASKANRRCRGGLPVACRVVVVSERKTTDYRFTKDITIIKNKSDMKQDETR
jgi:hypothetical protein